jgi:hypothetical protein
VYKDILRNFAIGPTAVTDWLLLSQGHPLGVFRTYEDAVTFLTSTTIYCSERRQSSLIIPFLYNYMDGSETTSEVSNRTIIDTIKHYITLLESAPRWAKCGYADILFLYITQHPAFIAQHAGFYTATMNKVREFSQVIRKESNVFPQSHVLLDVMPAFLRTVKMRKDFAGQKTRPITHVQPTKTHNYNLRKNRKRTGYYVS